MIAIIDYGVGNLFSLQSSLREIGAEFCVTGDEKEIRSAEKLLLPGVGAFGDAMCRLRETGLDRVIQEEARNGKPMMGICLGMQLLFEKSYEFGEQMGFGLLKGEIRPIRSAAGEQVKIPHIGWNQLQFTKQDSRLFRYIEDGTFVYFVHSYYAADCRESVIANTDYGAEITAAVEQGNICGCQFHPEKSGTTGLKILRAFCEEDEKR